MPTLFFDHLPLPNLKTYTCASVIALTACIYYATCTVRDPNWNRAKSDLDITHNTANGYIINNDTNGSVDGRTFGQFTGDTFSVLAREPICVSVSLSCLYYFILTLVQFYPSTPFKP